MQLGLVLDRRSCPTGGSHSARSLARRVRVGMRVRVRVRVRVRTRITVGVGARWPILSQ